VKTHSVPTTTREPPRQKSASEKHLAKPCADTRSISARQERNFSGKKKKKKKLTHKELLTGFMLIAFKSQLTGSAVIRVPLQDVKIHLIQIHFSNLKLVDKTVYQLNVTRAGLYALSGKCYF
jgi:hypothetical protein